MKLQAKTKESNDNVQAYKRTLPAANIKNPALRYHLRFQIIPGKKARRDAGILAEHCLRHGVEEVVLFFAGEEWNNGRLSQKDEDVWFKTIKAVKEVLDTSGI